jgi:hypothetical protein
MPVVNYAVAGSTIGLFTEVFVGLLEPAIELLGVAT